jgi:4-hydroxybenzoate polyprenyltransferase/phosphoserine phosphatase
VATLTKAEARPIGEALTVDLPLCVDLDGTLVKVDTMQEAAFGATVADWAVLFRIPVWLVIGKARLKQELARRWQFDPAHLPYNEALLDYLRAERARGRPIVLSTAATQQVADRIAAHLGLFDRIIASDGVTNLRGPAKAEALCRAFGAKRFVYVGNDSTDHAVWGEAAGAVLVNARSGVSRTAKVRYPVVAIIDDGAGRMRAAVKALRPYQWVKNLLTFVPLFVSGGFADLTAWVPTIAIFAAFCAFASVAYILNDMTDLAADRAHPRKSRRPFASGALSIGDGLAILPGLTLVGLALGWYSGALPALLFYMALSLSYNLKLKEMPLIDVFVLGGLYTLRLFAGGEASGHRVSLWLLGFSSFLFLSLALIKRVSELYRLPPEQGGELARRGYVREDMTILQMMGVAASFTSALVLSLYVQSDTALHAYAHPSLLWGAVPLMLFWQCRLWLSTARGYMQDDPIVYAAGDWVSWLVMFCLVCLALGAFIPFGGLSV